MSQVVQSRYKPGTILAEVFGTEWETVAIPRPSLTEEQLDEMLEKTRRTFPSREYRLVDGEIPPCPHCGCSNPFDCSCDSNGPAL